MFRIITCCLTLALLSLGTVSAQLIHFSDYNTAPLSLSPALAGAYQGSVRIGGNYREQYRAFINDPYQTTTLFVDSPLALGLPENQWIGIGANVSKTEAGDLSQQQVSTRIGLSYHRALDRKMNTIIGIGVQYNYASRTINNPTAARFEDQLVGLVTVSQDQQLIDDAAASYSGLNAGFYIKKRFNKKLRFEGGLGVDHLTKTSFVSSASSYSNKIPLRYNVYGEWMYRSSKKVILNPSFVLQRYGPVSNLMGIFGIRHRYNEKKNMILTYKLGYRIRDAGFLGVGAMFNNYTVSLTYDMTLSSARNYNGTTGALELGFSKIFIIHPRVKHKIVELCPRL